MRTTSTFLMSVMFMVCSMTIAIAQSWKHDNISVYVGTHKTMAILPFEVVTRYVDSSPQSPEQIAQESQANAYRMQRSLADYFVTQKPKKHDWTTRFQDISETNRLLQQAGIDYATMCRMPKDSLCRLLGVDAVIYAYTESIYSLTNRPPETVRTRTGYTTYGGYSTYTGQLQVQFTVYDAENGEMVWRYSRQMYSGEHEMVAENLMKRAIESFPWKTKK